MIVYNMNYSSVKTSVYCTFRREDFHCRPEAPEEVAFLRTPHRHVFHARVDVSVLHDDRDIEFILLKRKLEAFVADVVVNMKGNKSCEMIAEKICRYVIETYEPNWVKVDVSEDGENGGIYERNIE